MRTKAEIEKKIEEERELLKTKEIEVILNMREDKDNDAIFDSLRVCTDITRRIDTLRWVLGEFSEL